MLLSSFIAAALSVAAAGDITLPVSHPIAPVSLTSSPEVGAEAPNFDYQSYDYRWLRFHHMLQRDAIVMVFSPDDATLTGLEQQRESLAERGIAPVAVFTRRDGEVWRIATRLKLGYSLLADPRGAIAQSFGVWDAPSEVAASAWYVIGSDGLVRACGRGPLQASALALAALSALGFTPDVVEPPAAAN